MPSRLGKSCAKTLNRWGCGTSARHHMASSRLAHILYGGSAPAIAKRLGERRGAILVCALKARHKRCQGGGYTPVLFLTTYSCSSVRARLALSAKASSTLFSQSYPLLSIILACIHFILSYNYTIKAHLGSPYTYGSALDATLQVERTKKIIRPISLNYRV